VRSIRSEDVEQAQVVRLGRCGKRQWVEILRSGIVCTTTIAGGEVHIVRVRYGRGGKYYALRRFGAQASGWRAPDVPERAPLDDDGGPQR